MEDTSQSVGLSKISQISVTVHDLEEAVSFYRDVLGMHLLFQVPKMAFFDCEGIRLMLAVPDKPEFDHPSSIIYFQVEDIHGVYAKLADRGVVFEGTPQRVAKLDQREIWMAFFRDVDRNLLALTSEVPC